MRALAHTFVAQRAARLKAEREAAAVRKSGERTGEVRGARDGYARARAEFTKVLTPQPGEHVAIHPPEQPFWLVALPLRAPVLFSDRDLPRNMRQRLVEFEFQAERVAVNVGDDDLWGPVTLTWWRPVFKGVRL